MTDTNSIPIFGIQILLTSNSNIILIASFIYNAFASLFNKTETTMLLVGRLYGFKSITLWLISLSTVIILYTCAIHWLLSKDSWIIHYICHVEMQLNDVMKVSPYRY